MIRENYERKHSHADNKPKYYNKYELIFSKHFLIAARRRSDYQIESLARFFEEARKITSQLLRSDLHAMGNDL